MRPLRLVVGALALLPVLSMAQEAAPSPAPLRLLDLSKDESRRVVVDREPGQYLGHVSTLLLDDNKTILAVYPKGHGKGQIVYKRSPDGGLTWSDRLPTPASWATSKEIPTLFKTVDRMGIHRLLLFTGRMTSFPNETIRLSTSDDEGATWGELQSIGNFGGVAAMSSVVPLNNGSYMALFHDEAKFTDMPEAKLGQESRVFKTLSDDGGLTWSAPTVIARIPDAFPCEPCGIRSPDGKEIAVLMRENTRKFNSFVMFSRDEGVTWTTPRELPASLTGDRHVAKYTPDGRLFISFRDTSRTSKTRGNWVAWVGTYDDIAKGRDGQYRVLLMRDTKGYDCGYSGVEVLPDATVVATTYGRWTAGEEPYIISVRLKLAELDALAAQPPAPSSP